MSKNSTSEKWIRIIEKSQAVELGHFRATNDFHTRAKIHTDKILIINKNINSVSQAMFDLFKDSRPTHVLTPNKSMGYLIAAHVARRFKHGKIKYYYYGREDGTLIPPYVDFDQIVPCESRVLVVDDGINTGNSLRQIISSVRNDLKAECVGAAIFINRYPKKIEDEFKDTRIEVMVNYINHPIIDLQKKECPYDGDYRRVSEEVQTLEIEGKTQSSRYVHLLKKKSNLTLQPLYE